MSTDHDTSGEHGSGGTSRRTLLKAASAAGIVWASPALTSVTAHAAGTCVSLEFDDTLTATETFDPADDAFDCVGTAFDCTPAGGTNSKCTNCSYQIGVLPPADPGSITGSNLVGYTYTAPSGCTILGAAARIQDTNGSGCEGEFPCQTGTITSPTQATFPPVSGTQNYYAYRFVLCCGS